VNEKMAGRDSLPFWILLLFDHCRFLPVTGLAQQKRHASFSVHSLVLAKTKLATEASHFPEKGREMFRPADLAADPGEARTRVTAVKITLDDLPDGSARGSCPPERSDHHMLVSATSSSVRF